MPGDGARMAPGARPRVWDGVGSVTGERRAGDRLRGAAGAAAIVVLLGLVLALGLRGGRFARAVEPPVMLSLAPPTIEVRRPPAPFRAAAGLAHALSAAARAVAPAASRARATPVVAPRAIASAMPVIAAATPGRDAAAAGGASDRAGAGSGAGGRGDGGGGEGEGDGGDGTPPELLRGGMSYRDLPYALKGAGVRGLVSVRYDVGADGRARDCEVTRSSGIAAMDALTCALIVRRFRYAPARSADGERVASSIEEDHRWSVDGDGGEELSASGE